MRRLCSQCVAAGKRDGFAQHGAVAEVVGQIRVVKSFVQEKRELLTFTRHYDATIGLTKEQSRYWHSMDAARRGVMNVIFFAIYALVWLGQYLGIRRRLREVNRALGARRDGA